jgi:hypothetical protein
LAGALALAALLMAVGCSKSADESAAAPSESMKRDAGLNGLAASEFDGTKSMPASGGASMAGPPSEAPMHYAARQQGSNRSVLRQASLGVDVENLDKAEQGMRELITKNGGYIHHEESDNLASEQPTLRLTIRVPEKSFEEVLAGFQALGRRTQLAISASDLTEQILDAEAELKQLKQNSQDYGAAERIKNAQQQRDSLASQAAMSTIELTLQQRANAGMSSAANANWGTDTWNSAMSAAIASFRVVGAIAIWLLAFSPIWGAILVAGWLGARSWKRSVSRQTVVN